MSHPTHYFATILAITMLIGAPLRLGRTDDRLQAAAAQQSENLGRFNVGPFTGLVSLQERNNHVLIVVYISNLPPVPSERPIPAETVQVWVLRAEGKASTLKESFPSPGSPLVGIGSGGGVDFQRRFTFEKTERPIAVVVTIGDHFQVFAVPRKASAK